MPVLLLLSWTLTCCSPNDDQAEFVSRAHGVPDGITETDGSGQTVENGRTDPDDWRIAPDFGHLVYSAGPAYPNPVQTTDDIHLELDVRPQAVTGVMLLAGLRDCGLQFELSPPLDERQETLPAGITSLRINAGDLACSGSQGVEPGLKRILLFDRNGNLISYGDIEIQ